ncbi:restriction endonuclease subunit S [Pseudoalteromonas nigrifaciens]|uniref:restriction endonuclease subunit S n=1 Tax=Pseudoalteromonas nigrifaciens TaxID=28109 RepID=UPI0030CA5608
MGWSISKISEVTNIISGGTPKSGISDYWFGDVKWITPKDMGKVTDIYVSETSRNITQLGLDKSSAKLIPKNSVILSTRAPIGHLAINAVPMATNQGCRGLVPKSTLDTKFLYYFLLKSVSLLNDLGSGTTFKELSKTVLEKVEIPYPEISEQKRIVAILDQAFADIEQARAKTEKNLKNARELFESYLQQVFSLRGEGWVESTLGAATGGIYTGPFGSLLHKSDYIENGIPLVNPAHITALGIEIDNRKTVSKETAERLSSYIMEKGDVVIGRRGEMGRCALVTSQESGFLCGTGSFFIKSSSRCDSGYLVRYLRSASCVARLEKIAGGAVMPNLSNKDLSNLEIIFPPIEKQIEILELIDILSAETEKVALIYQKKLTVLEELKKSILRKAFSGELTKMLEGETNKGVVA